MNELTGQMNQPAINISKVALLSAFAICAKVSFPSTRCLQFALSVTPPKDPYGLLCSNSLDLCIREEKGSGHESR